MASQRGRARVAEKPRGGFVFGSSTPRELSYVRGPPTATRSADASSNGSPSADGAEKQHNLSYYMRQARSITPSCGERNKSWAFGSSTPRQFSHLNSIKPELRVYDVKIQTKSARSHTAPSINDRPPKAPSAAPKPRPAPAPVHKTPKNDDADSVSSEPDFRDHRPTFSRPPAGKKPNGTAAKTPTSTRKVSGTTAKTTTTVTKTTTVKKTSTVTAPKKPPTAPTSSPVAKKISLTEKKASPEKRRGSAGERVAPPLAMAAEQEHVVPKAVHTNQEYEGAVSSVPSAAMRDDTSEVMQEDACIEELVEQKQIAQNQSANFGGIAANVADKINEVLTLAGAEDQDDVEERFEVKMVKEKEPEPEAPAPKHEPEAPAAKKDDLFAGLGGFLSSASEKIRGVVQEAEKSGIDVAEIAEKGFEMVKEKVGAEKDVQEEECVAVQHDFGKKEDPVEDKPKDEPKTLMESAGDLLGDDVIDTAIGFVQSLKLDPALSKQDVEPSAPKEEEPVEQVEEEIFEQKIVQPHGAEFHPSHQEHQEIEDVTKDSVKAEAELLPSSGPATKSDDIAEVEKALDQAKTLGDTVAAEAEEIAAVPQKTFDSTVEDVRKVVDTVITVTHAESEEVLDDDKVEDTVEHVQESVKTAADTVSEGVKHFTEESSELGHAAKDEISDFVRDTKEEVSKKFDSVRDAAEDVVDWGKSAGSTVAEEFRKASADLIEFAGDTVATVGNTVSEGAAAAKDVFAAGAVQLQQGSDTVVGGVEKATDYVFEGGEHVAHSVAEEFNKATDTVTHGAESTVDTLSQVYNDTVEETGKAADSVGHEITEAHDTVAQGLQYTAESIGHGVEKAATTVSEGAKKAADTVSEGYKDTVEGAGKAVETVGEGIHDVAHSVADSVSTKAEEFSVGAQSVLGEVKGTAKGAEKTATSIGSKISSFFGGKD